MFKCYSLLIMCLLSMSCNQELTRERIVADATTVVELTTGTPPGVRCFTMVTSGHEYGTTFYCFQERCNNK